MEDTYTYNVILRGVIRVLAANEQEAEQAVMGIDAARCDECDIEDTDARLTEFSVIENVGTREARSMAASSGETAMAWAIILLQRKIPFTYAHDVYHGQRSHIFTFAPEDAKRGLAVYDDAR